MFSRVLRDKLLFEDEEFTYSRRYFWAYQTLGTMNNAIKAIIDSYESTFTSDFWEGKHKSLWPMIDSGSARNVYWKKRMLSLKKDFEKEIKGLTKLYDDNDDRRKEIRTLRDQLFSGTSVLESRKSVELSAVTILQGHNIKLLTLVRTHPSTIQGKANEKKVSIFFLPLTFVTSVFGMSNMSQEEDFKTFGVVMVVVCLPFFLLIGSLNTTAGMTFWRDKWHRLLNWFKRIGSTQNSKPEPPVQTSPGVKMRRSHSTARAIDIRKNQLKGPTSPNLSESRNGRTSSSRFDFHSRATRPDASPIVATLGHSESTGKTEPKKSKEEQVVVDDRPPRPETIRPPLTWREAVFGRKTKPIWGQDV